MGRKKLTDEEKAARKLEREKKKAGIVEEVKEEVKEIADKVEEEVKEEVKALEGKATKEEFPDTDIGIDVFSQK